MKYTKQDIEESKAYLKTLFEPSIKTASSSSELPLIQCVIRKVSRTGMTRKMDFYYYECQEDKQHSIRSICLTKYFARVLGWGLDRNGYLIVNGCGMDMAFHTFYCVGSVLWNKEEATALNYVSHRNGDKTPESSGGYLLKHEVL